jgi:hypothetical protein
MASLIGVFRTKRLSEVVTQHVQSSKDTKKPVTIAVENAEPIVATFVGESNDIAIGTTQSGDFIAICLGDRTLRSVRHGTIVIERP